MKRTILLSFLLTFIPSCVLGISGKQPADSTLIAEGQALYYCSDYLKSFEIFMKLLPRFEARKDTASIACCKGMLGVIFLNIEEYDKAIAYLETAEHLFQNIGNLEMSLQTRKDLAIAWGNKGDTQKARQIMRDAINSPEFSEVSEKLKIASLFTYCDYLQNTEEEKTNIGQAYSMAEHCGDSMYIHAALLNKGWLCLKEHYPDSAIQYAEQVYKAVKSDTVNLLDLNQSCCDLLSQSHALKADWKTAYLFKELSDKYTNIIKGTSVVKNVQRLEIQKEIENHRFRLKESQLKTTQQRRILWIVIIAFLLLAILSVFTVYQLRKRIAVEQQLRQLEKKTYHRQLGEEAQKVEAKTRELSSNILLMLKKNTVLSELSGQIDAWGASGEITLDIVRQMKNKIGDVIKDDNEWTAFKIQFEEIHPSFFKKLLTHHPDLSDNDLRICAYCKLNLTTKQISQMLSVQQQSVIISRYRIKKKMNLPKESSLKEYLNNF